MSNLSHVKATAYGQVQGVFYRAFTLRVAKSLGLNGYVRNLSKTRVVEVCAEGERAKIEELLMLMEAGPPESLVERIETEWSEFTGQFANFNIR